MAIVIRLANERERCTTMRRLTFTILSIVSRHAGDRGDWDKGVALIGSRDGLQAVNVLSSGAHNEVYSTRSLVESCPHVLH